MQTRLALIAGSAAVGIVLQMLVSLFWGWAFILAAALLAAVRARNNRPQWTGPGKWQDVTMDELNQIEGFARKAQEVRAAAGVFGTASVPGCAMGCLLIVGTILVTVMLAGSADRGLDEHTLLNPVVRGGSLSLLFFIDSLTMLLPLWLFGRVSTWEPPDLRTRVEQLSRIHELLNASANLTFQPSLMIRETEGGAVPTDCRLMVGIRDADPGFMGIQVQTTLNKVQSRTYPYTYCVLIAKPEFGLMGKAGSVIENPPPKGFATRAFADSNEKKEAGFARFQDKLVEPKIEGDVEIVVVRQNTKGSGYHTNPKQAESVFRAAVALATQIL